MSLGFILVLIFLSVILFSIILSSFSAGIFITTIIVVIVLVIKNYTEKVKQRSNKNNIEVENIKLCKYCRSEIDFEATVCPVCRKAQSNANNPIWLVPIFVIIGLFLYCLLSPNAPETAREIFCATGLRKGYPYCYKIDTDKLNDLINRYRY